jgi:hypothetical protein
MFLILIILSPLFFSSSFGHAVADPNNSDSSILESRATDLFFLCLAGVMSSSLWTSIVVPSGSINLHCFLAVVDVGAFVEKDVPA